MTPEQRRERMRSWKQNTDVDVKYQWNGVQRGDECVWDDTGERCVFVAHATDTRNQTEWWTFATPDHEKLMHASRVYFVWTDGPALHGVL